MDNADFINHIFFRDPEWVDSLVLDFQSKGVEKVLSCIQISASYLEIPFPKDEFCACIHQSMYNQSYGIVFRSREQLQQENLKQDCVKEILIK